MRVLRFDQYDKIISIVLNLSPMFPTNHTCMIAEQQFPFQTLVLLAFVNYMAGQVLHSYVLLSMKLQVLQRGNCLVST